MDHTGPTLTHPTAGDLTISTRQCYQPGAKDSLPGLPAGFAAFLDHSLAWTGADFKHDEFVCQLSDDDRLELHAALDEFKGIYPGVFTSRNSADMMCSSRARW